MSDEEEIPQIYHLARGVSEKDYVRALRARRYLWGSIVIICTCVAFGTSIAIFAFGIALNPKLMITLGGLLSLLMAKIFDRAFKLHTVQYQTYSRWRAVKKYRQESNK